MHLDVLDLRAFYYRTKLGRAAQRALQDALRGLWPETRDLSVVGFGFAAPVLRPFLADARRVISLMPAQQGVMPWPVGAPNVAALVEETQWPIESDSVDRLIVAHGLETCDQPGALLDEIWRSLSGGGRVVFIVPNRSGLWAQRDVTPFGFGRPYSLGQMKALLGRHGLVPERHASALYAPPSHRRFWLQTAQVWEYIGRRFDPHLIAGALLVEARKEVLALPRKGAKAPARSRLGSLEGLGRPQPEPVATPRRMDP
jgi:SAM-dependent methyltransferase